MYPTLVEEMLEQLTVLSLPPNRVEYEAVSRVGELAASVPDVEMRDASSSSTAAASSSSDTSDGSNAAAPAAPTAPIYSVSIAAEGADDKPHMVFKPAPKVFSVDDASGVMGDELEKAA